MPGSPKKKIRNPPPAIAIREPGRPTLYRPEFPDLAYRHCLLGATDVNLAVFFDVAPDTIDDWKVAYPDFLGAIKRGRQDADSHVAASLYQRACGYTHPEEKIFIHEGEIIRADTTKHYPPDTAAAFIWLKNRQPEHWRDRKEVDVRGAFAHLHLVRELRDGVDGLTDEEAEQLAMLEAKRLEAISDGEGESENGE